MTTTAAVSIEEDRRRAIAEDNDDNQDGGGKAGERHVNEPQDNGARGIRTSMTRVLHLLPGTRPSRRMHAHACSS